VYLKKNIYKTPRNHILVIFVLTTENGWLASMGPNPNKRKIGREESWKYLFPLVIRAEFQQKYIFPKKIYPHSKNPRKDRDFKCKFKSDSSH